MPVVPTSGIPPLSTLHQIDNKVATFTPTFIAPGLTHRNFYSQNGQMILAAMVVLLLMIMFILSAALGVGPHTIFSQG